MKAQCLKKCRVEIDRTLLSQRQFGGSKTTHLAVVQTPGNSSWRFDSVLDIIRAKGIVTLEGMVRMLGGLPEVLNPSFKAGCVERIRGMCVQF
jgi:hypothetical protein